MCVEAEGKEKERERSLPPEQQRNGNVFAGLAAMMICRAEVVSRLWGGWLARYG